MVCPYNRKSETQTLMWEQNPTEENETVMKNGKQITKTTFELMECSKENCGVYRNGKCCYASVNFDNC